MIRADVDDIVRACGVWVQSHFRTTLSGKDLTAIRTRLLQKFDAARSGDTREFCEIAHRMACDVVTRCRDRAQQAEHSRMARR